MDSLRLSIFVIVELGLVRLVREVLQGLVLSKVGVSLIDI